MTTYNIENPYLALLKKREKISKAPSTKDVYTLTIDIKNSNISYCCGDSAAILPTNDPETVKKTLHFMNAAAEKRVYDHRAKKEVQLADYLSNHVTITRFSPFLLRLLLLHQKDPKKKEELEKLLDPKNKDALSEYISNHEVWDALQEYNSKEIPAQEICERLSPLLPRLYSIASSPKVHPDEIVLLVAEVSYHTSGHRRFGVASHFLCQTAKENETPLPLYIHKASNFYLPPDSDAHLIMIGAGTGIAPYHSFLQERYHTKAEGKNWLFFGDRHKQGNFYFESFLDQLKTQSFLRLDTAFSRDQEEKIYVQHLLRKNSQEVWKWLNEGAYLYVCGDARTMARDVDLALRDIIEQEGQMNEADARAYIRNLYEEARYRRDIY